MNISKYSLKLEAKIQITFSCTFDAPHLIIRGLPYMTSANSNQLILFLPSTFWRPPTSSDVIYGSPLISMSSPPLSAAHTISPLPDARVQERPPGAEEAGSGDRRRPSGAGSPHRGSSSGKGTRSGDHTEKVSYELW